MNLNDNLEIPLEVKKPSKIQQKITENKMLASKIVENNNSEIFMQES